MLAGAGMLVAGVCGIAVAVDPRAGLALLVGAGYLGLAVVNLPLALALWVPLVFLEGLSAFNAGAKATGVVLLAAWLPAVMARGGARPAWVTPPSRRLMEPPALLVLWLCLSLLWASDPGAVLADAWHWVAVAVIFALVASSLPTPAAVRAVLIAFVAGALLSILAGLGSGGFGSEATAGQLASGSGARLGGALGDPNFLAAGLVPAVVLAAGLAATTRSALARLVFAVAIVALIAGAVASESRGGAIAGLVALAAALVCFRGRRARVSLIALAVVALAAAWFSVSPAAWERVTSFDSGGSGRSDLWTVAFRVAEEDPVLGAGLNNFASVAGDFVRDPGALTQVALLTEDPQVVHNTYLQLLAEVGIVGLVLFLAFVAACLRANWLAARVFRMRGDPAGETIAQAVMVATIAMLAAAFFVSAGVDKRLWILLALGPGLLALARRTPRRGD